jgi:hypothetical protein
MMKRILGIVVALAVPTLLAAQTPIPANEHASETAKSKLIPSAHASDMAKQKVAAAMARRATHVRGEAIGLDNRPVTPATRATPAQPGAGEGGRAIPATPATPASPALAHRPPQAGTGHGRKP